VSGIADLIRDEVGELILGKGRAGDEQNGGGEAKGENNLVTVHMCSSWDFAKTGRASYRASELFGSYSVTRLIFLKPAGKRMLEELGQGLCHGDVTCLHNSCAGKLRWAGNFWESKLSIIRNRLCAELCLPAQNAGCRGGRTAVLQLP